MLSGPFTPTPILDQLLHETRTGGIRTGRHCADELPAHPGEVFRCARPGGHRGDHVDYGQTVTW
jgi:hypothetical protein